MSDRRRRYRRHPVAVADRVGRFRGGSGAPTGELAAVQAAWSEIVGPQVAAKSTVTRRSRAGIVTVACADAMWTQDLHSRADVLADQLTRALPHAGITGVRFVTADHAIPGAEPRPHPPTVKPTDAELAAAAAAVGDVSDPELRDLLTRAAAGQMAVARLRTKSLQNAANRGRVDRDG
jgi:hypothetical protein